MSSITSLNNFSASMSQAMLQNNRQIFSDVRQAANQLADRRDAVSQAGLRRVQESNEIASKLAQGRSKIDVFA